MLIQGNALEKLKEIENNSVDCIVTDPPYGYSFMGKDWDNFKAKKVTKSQVVTNLGVGMRKTTAKENLNYQKWVSEWASECLRVAKSGSFMFYFMTPRQDLLSRAIIGLEEAGWIVSSTSIYWTYATGFPKANSISKAIKRRKSMKKSHRSKELQGSYGGFQPKPAVEVIIVAMKPLDEKTYIDQAIVSGKGITWMDDCRIPYISDYDKKHQQDIAKGSGILFGGKGISKSNGINDGGRFPANLLVSDDVLNDGEIRNSIKSKYDDSHSGGIWKKSTGKPAGPTYSDCGSYSRYFDLDTWANKMNFGNLPEQVQKTLPFLIVSKPTKSEREIGLDKLNMKEENGRKNYHPTVKPIKILSYLITLGSRENDIILDPFMGSGSTGVAALLLKRKFTGIELSDDYMKIARGRINNYNEHKKFVPRNIRAKNKFW